MVINFRSTQALVPLQAAFLSMPLCAVEKRSGYRVRIAAQSGHFPRLWKMLFRCRGPFNYYNRIGEGQPGEEGRGERRGAGHSGAPETSERSLWADYVIRVRIARTICVDIWEKKKKNENQPPQQGG